LTGVLGVGGIVAFMVLLRRHLYARRRAATAIAEQGERLRTTLASIGDAVMATDPEGLITMMNGVAETLTGWKADEAAGLPLEAVFRIVNEETRRPVENPATRALREGLIVGLANHTVLIDKGGGERAIDDSAAPIRCKEGKVVGCVLVFRDVTEQRRDEANLWRQASLLEQSYDAIFVWESRGPIVYWNKAAEELYGYTRQEAVGRATQDLLATVFPQQDIAAFQAALERQGEFKGELVHTRKNGERVMVESRIRLMSRGDGRRLVLETCRDITERKAAEEEQRRLLAALSEADRRKDEFLATLAHELRNPLAPIRNGLHILRMTDQPEVGERARAMMERQLTQLVHLVDDLMDVSRISRNMLQLRKERAPLAAALDSAVEASRPLIDRMGHELTITRPSHPIYLDADMTRLTQVFGNLLNNAAKYTQRGGRIWLTAERQGSDAVVSVRDDGIGIDPALMPHIFGMFMQVDRSLERSQGGLGIGLTLVKRLVEMHGGTIDARSEGPGRGSEFIVRLPIVVEAAVPPPAEREESAAPRSSFRILIVDDNRDGADSLAMMLRSMGNEPRTAYDGQQALDEAEEFRPDVVLLDIGLPKLNGYEACRRIRERPWGKSVVLIALTGWGQDEDRRRSRESGFDHHMVKPVDPLDLMKLLADLDGVRP
jgi:PAS domain S-box-containing protein